MDALKIKIKRFDKELPMPKIIDEGDWIDLYCAEDIVMKQGEQKLIPLGVGVIMPSGFEGWLLPRSSTAKKFGITKANHKGIIDNSFCGETIGDRSKSDEWKFNALAIRDTTIKKGDRIAQFRIFLNQKATKDDKQNWLNSNGVEIVEIETLNDKVRNGFGHTGHENLK